MSKSRLAVLAVLFCAAICPAQDTTTAAIRNWREAHERAIITEFIDFVRIPDLAADPEGLAQERRDAPPDVRKARGQDSPA